MATPATKSSAAGEWTIVSYRRGRPRGSKSNPLLPHFKDPPTLFPSSWAPADPVVDLDRQSKLLQRMQSTIQRLERSRFYQRFLRRFRDPEIQNGLAGVSFSGPPEIQMVVYGIGSIESYDPPRLQLALALLLRRELGHAEAASLEVFDPVLSATECAVLAALGCKVVPVNEQGRREVSAPTLFYMPHCEAALYDALLEANWRPAALKRMVILGNSFTAYQQYVETAGVCRGSISVETAAKHILSVRRLVMEVEIEEKWEVGASGEGKQEEEDGIFKAFHDTTWHFFQMDNDRLELLLPPLLTTKGEKMIEEEGDNNKRMIREERRKREEKGKQKEEKRV